MEYKQFESELFTILQTKNDLLEALAHEGQQPQRNKLIQAITRTQDQGTALINDYINQKIEQAAQVIQHMEAIKFNCIISKGEGI